MKPDVIEEQVDVEGLIADRERHLAADEGEAPAKFEQQVAQMDEQAPLNLPFVGVFGHGQKVEVVRVFQNLLGQIGAGRGERALEVGQRLPFPLVQGALDLEDQDISAPAVFDRGAEIPCLLYTSRCV